jgi:hypothetical protein
MFKSSLLTLILGFAIAFSLSSCGGKGGAKNENVYLNDFEAFYGFNEKVDKGKAHVSSTKFHLRNTKRSNFRPLSCCQRPILRLKW